MREREREKDAAREEYREPSQLFFCLVLTNIYNIEKDLQEAKETLFCVQ
jgi:hypothetical protein